MILLYGEHRRRYIWNVIVMASATFMALYLPLSLHMDFTPSVLLRDLFWASELIFVADIFVRYYRFRKEQAGSDQSWRAFFPGWVLIDWIAAFPFGLVSGLGYLQIFRLVKLIRVAQFIRLFRQVEVRFSITLTLVSFFFWAALLIHWLCCGWMAVYGVDPNADVVTNYVSALYWTMTTLTAVGYGDIVPLTNLQRLYAIVVQVTGLAVFGYLIGNVVSIISRLDAAKARYVEHVELFMTALKRRGLSLELQRRILEYYSYLRDEKMGYDESAFLQTLPESLRKEVALYLKQEFIESIPLFKNASERFIVDIALKLELILATPGDYIFKADDPGDEMFFIISGEVEVLNKQEDRLLVKLKEGDYFGEIALFTSNPRSATVKAADYCNLYKLTRQTFASLRADHPEIAAQIEKTARARDRQQVS